MSATGFDQQLGKSLRRINVLSAPQGSSAKRLAAYLGLMIVAVAIIVGVIALGTQPTDAETIPVRSADPSHLDTLFHVLVTLAAVIALGALFAKICRYLGQPPVIGEILAGLALGPSVLGEISPEAMHWLIPTAAADPHGSVTHSLKVIAQLGVILYMFLVGLELNLDQLKHKAQSAVAISHASIILPFTLGVIFALWLHERVDQIPVPFTSFSLFLGVAMSITAFPVLARILTDRGLQQTPVGSIALSCAAVDDVTAWCLLSLVVGIAQGNLADVTYVFLFVGLFLLVVWFVVRPLLTAYLHRIERNRDGIAPHAVTLIYVAILTAAATTEQLGIHAIFGAFLLGAIIPSDSRIAASFRSKLIEPVSVLMLPAFFALTGMRTEIGLLNSPDQWLICLAVIAVAVIGKFGGTYLAAITAGETSRDATILGMLMNTRGLMELIVLNIGLDLGVIGKNLFAMMVIMALVTTMMTAPVISRLMPARS